MIGSKEEGETEGEGSDLGRLVKCGIYRHKCIALIAARLEAHGPLVYIIRKPK